MIELDGRVGRARGGDHAGMYISLERHESGAGWHIWVLREDPRSGPSDGWDIWADNEAQLFEWIGVDHLDVEWLD